MVSPARSRSTTAWPRLPPPRGVFLAFATQPDTIAEEGRGTLSPFAAALTKYLDLPDTTVSEMMSHVRRLVYDSTGGRQLPWDRSELEHSFMLRPIRCNRQVPLEQMLAQEQAEAGRASEYWALSERTPNPDLLRSFLHQFPHSPHRPQALFRLDELRWEGLRNRLAVRAGAALLAVVLLAASWIGIEYGRFGDAGGLLRGAQIVGNDVAVPGAESRAVSIARCRLRCIVNTQCTAITWIPEPAGPGAPPTTGLCELKLAATYFSRPEVVRHGSAPRSELIRRRDMPLPSELPAGSHVIADRTLAGEAVPRERVLAEASLLDHNGRAALREDPQTGKFYWRVTNAACHQRCEDLRGDCKGFSYTPLGQRCLLFRNVKSVVRDAEGAAVHTPSVHSVCFDMTVADCRGNR